MFRNGAAGVRIHPERLDWEWYGVTDQSWDEQALFNHKLYTQLHIIRSRFCMLCSSLIYLQVPRAAPSLDPQSNLPRPCPFARRGSSSIMDIATPLALW